MTTTALQVRYFAGAAAAAGTDEARVELPASATLGDLADQLGADNEHLARVVRVASFVVDGRVTADRTTALAGVAAVDVLPPFAGG